MSKVSLLLVVLVCAFSALGQVTSSVSVVGEANMSISPDQVVFTFEVVTDDKEVTAAKQTNDERASKTLAAIKKFKIGDNDIQTDSLTIAPKYSTTFRVLTGYEVTKRILVTLKNLDKIDDFVSSVIGAGVNRVVDVSIENSEQQKYEEEVRSRAVKNAQAKASAYAKQLGQTIGKAYVIREENGDLPYSTSVQGIGGGFGDGNGDAGLPETTASTPTAYDRMVTFSLGKIKIEEKIYVIFELNK